MGDSTANHETEPIIARGLRVGRAIAAEIRRRIKAVAGLDLPQEELLRRVRHVLARHEPLLVRNLNDTLLAAWLAAGAKIVAEGPFHEPAEPPTPLFPPPPLPPAFTRAGDPDDAPPVVRFPLIERAAQDLAERRILTRLDFDTLAAEAKAAAFTVARVASLDTLDKIRQALAEDVSRGGTLRAFRERVADVLDETALTPAHVETVYRTNVAQAYAAGLDRVLANPLVGDEFPYMAYHAVHDSRTRPEHLSLEKHGLQGTNVYRRDDPFWDLFTPPWSWQCRCNAVPLTLEDAARLGIREAREWLKTSQPPAVPQYVTLPDFGPPPEWRGRPKLVAVA